MHAVAAFDIDGKIAGLLSLEAVKRSQKDSPFFHHFTLMRSIVISCLLLGH